MRFIQAWKMYGRIPMKCQSVLPDEGFTPRPVHIVDGREDLTSLYMVYCKPANKDGSSKHRVFVQCDCGRDIPFGRMGQHFKTHGRIQ